MGSVACTPIDGSPSRCVVPRIVAQLFWALTSPLP